ncbi:MAG TPA: carbamoyltransferase C-terminal domain-containing protein [Kofleriaceae bacterium]|nr:carbamoyltransferase C-terminal domain-containing protein [Kofleriaceae bacterium]
MILGLGGLDHNGAACLVEDGRVVAMLELERVTRRKNQGIDTPEALNTLLDRLDAIRATHVAVADRTWFAAASWLPLRFADRQLSVYSHHACHLAAAFVTSPLERSTVVAVDGKGDGLSASAGYATRAVAPDIAIAVPSAHSLGRLWWAASEYAGLPGHHSAGKTMALAAYGEAVYLDHLLRHRRIHGDGGFRLEPGDEHPDLFRQVPRLVEWMAKVTDEPQAAPRCPGQAHKDMAASVQRFTELVVEDFVGAAVAGTGCRDVCLAGGVALNGLVNQHLLERVVVDTLFVPPFTDDRGLAIGAAALAAYEQGEPVRPIQGGISPFLGPEPASTLARHSAFTWRGDGDGALDTCAEELNRGAVIGWFEGRDEAGPRALGHRSILASPTTTGMRDRLNLEIKRREPFRPFGCSILREHVSAWFECDDDSPYMLRIVRARPERRCMIESALHVDGTSRLHTVDRSHAPRLARLLDRMIERGHPPLLINTSLNGPGEPIVHTAEQAFAVARVLGLDALVVDGVLHAATGDE